MATIYELNKVEFEEWLKGRPPEIKELAWRFPPNKLFRMSTGSRCTIRGYSEDGTLIVNVSGQYNALMFERDVFGVPPEELEECDIPDNDEIVGTVLEKKEEVLAYLEIVRERMKEENDAS